MLGTIQSVLVLGQARDTRLGEFLSNPLDAKGVCDEWFADDGQVFVRPFLFDPLLRALDAALASFGATRRSARGVSEGWDTPYVHDTVDVLTAESGTTALGSAFGDWQCRSCPYGDGPHQAVRGRVQAHVPHAHQRGPSPKRFCWSRLMGSCGPL